MKNSTKLYNTTDISFIIPSYNTLAYTMIAYRSIRQYYPTNEIIMLDDGSDDGSWEWLSAQLKLDDNLRGWHNETGNILGHTVTYGMGIRMSKNPLFSIFHSDMVCGRNYLENMLKHWKPKAVVCATRVEPEGIYPQGKEKILKPFGAHSYDFNREAFDNFVEDELVASREKTSYSIFAPWMMSKEEFIDVFGDHDIKSYSPFPEEDADLFLRFHLADYKLIQSRDSLCYHFISKGHRGWAKNGVGKDDSMFKFYQNRARRNYLRKWHKWMMFDENHHPIKHPVYNIGFVLTDVISEDFLHFVEPWATNIFVDNMVCAERYIEKEQPTTKIDLKKRILNHGYIDEVNNDILLYFSQKDFMTNGNENSGILMKLTDILAEGVEDNAEMELGIFKMKTKTVKDISQTLIKV